MEWWDAKCADEVDMSKFNKEVERRALLHVHVCMASCMHVDMSIAFQNLNLMEGSGSLLEVHT